MKSAFRFGCLLPLVWGSPALFRYEDFDQSGLVTTQAHGYAKRTNGEMSSEGNHGDLGLSGNDEPLRISWKWLVPILAIALTMAFFVGYAIGGLGVAIFTAVIATVSIAVGIGVARDMFTTQSSSQKRPH